MLAVADHARLARFFGALAVKERVAPRLHVRPLVAELFLTDNCNLRCISCTCWRERTVDELSTQEWKDVLAQLRALPIYKVNFTGGEPLIRSDAIELMRHAQELGIRHMHLNTNGIRLTTERREQILAAGVRSFNISVDGPPATHDRIRGREGAFATTVEHLRGLIEARERYGLKIRMNFTVMRDNVETLPELARIAQHLHVRLYLNVATDKTFLFRHEQVSQLAQVERDPLRSVLAELEEIRRADPRWLPRYSDLSYIPRHFSDVVQPNLPCAESQLKLMVHSRGQIGGCWAHDPRFNVRDMSIADVVASDHYREEHIRFFRKQCVGCGSNYSLNLRWRPGTYVQDALWRLGRKSLAKQKAG
jgi:MoaA/NifB/PqqE/SkfB family radical SAM enzyme